MIFLEKIKVNENLSSSSIFGLTCQNKINYRKKNWTRRITYIFWRKIYILLCTYTLQKYLRGLYLMIRKNHRLLSKVFQIKNPISSSINLLFLKSICVIFFRQIKRRAKNVDTKNFNFHVLQNCTTRCYAQWYRVLFFFVQICVKILLELFGIFDI